MRSSPVLPLVKSPGQRDLFSGTLNVRTVSGDALTRHDTRARDSTTAREHEAHARREAAAEWLGSLPGVRVYQFPACSRGKNLVVSFSLRAVRYPTGGGPKRKRIQMEA